MQFSREVSPPPKWLRCPVRWHFLQDIQESSTQPSPLHPAPLSAPANGGHGITPAAASSQAQGWLISTPSAFLGTEVVGGSSTALLKTMS